MAKAAVVGVAESDQLVRLPVEGGDEEGGLVGLGAAVGEEDFVQPGRVIIRSRSASSIWERIRKSVLEWMMRSSCSLIGSLISGMA